jgi:hypothetical protein
MGCKFGLIILGFISSIGFIGCSDHQKNSINNTYYIEIVNCNDSIKKRFMDNITGKVSYQENNHVTIVSVNYLSGEHPGMHLYKPLNELNKIINEGTNKIRIEFKGNYTVDSTFYSIEKYRYLKDQWQKLSDIGFIKATTRNQQAAKTDLIWDLELTKQVTQTVIGSTY